MNSYVQLNVSEQKQTQLQEVGLLCDARSPLRIALWQEGNVTWIYPSMKEYNLYNEQLLTIRSINSTQEYELIRIQLYNNESMNQIVKVIVQYCDEKQRNTTAFYSPREKAIICFSDESVMMIGGSMNGLGMKQYAIQENSAYNHDRLLKQLETGKLPMSWLAQGDVCSTFTLEAELGPMDLVDGMIWTFHSTSEELVRSLKNEVLSSFL